MSPIAKVARVILILHGLLNIAQGIYCNFNPQGYIDSTGDLFVGTPHFAIRSIGLGAFGVGWYELIFACTNLRVLGLSTIPMRLAFAWIMGTSLGWGDVVVKYELTVAVVAALAAFA